MTPRGKRCLAFFILLILAVSVSISYNLRVSHTHLPQRQFLANRHDFDLLINEPNKCKTERGTSMPVFLLVLVHSAPKNLDTRVLVRKTWGSVSEVDGKRVVTMFLLGKPSDPHSLRKLQRESRTHHDLLMEDFSDTYRNLTLKSIMGMKWAGTFCGRSSYVMKTDDDMFVGYDSIVKYLAKSSTPSTKFMTGLVIHSSPIRDLRSKWYIPVSSYPDKYYPPFCSGSGYIVSGDMPPRIYAISLVTQHLHLEDVFIGLCVSKLKVIPVRHREFNNGPVKFNFCRYKSIFTTHLSKLSIAQKLTIWEDFTSSMEQRCSLYSFLHMLRLY